LYPDHDTHRYRGPRQLGNSIPASRYHRRWD
jgi:hypothetical protein